MMAPGNMNIRRAGLSIPQRLQWGIPVVQNGDWFAQRPTAGQGPRIVYDRQPWEGSPFIRLPADPLPPALGDPDDTYNQLLGTFASLVGAAPAETVDNLRTDVEQSIADRATASFMEQMRPYLIWGGVGVVGLALCVGFAGYALGRNVG